MYAARFDTTANLLEVRWDRILSPEDVDAFTEELSAGFRRHRFQRGYHLLLDLSAGPVQPQNTLAAFQAGFARYPHAGRIAVVASGALLRLQVRRVMTQTTLRLFDDMTGARAWLFSPADDRVTA